MTPVPNVCLLQLRHGKAATPLLGPATHGALTEGFISEAPDAPRTARRRNTPNATALMACRLPLENIR